MTFSLGFNPAGQAISRETSNAAYEYPMAAMTTVGYAPDGLNRYATVGAASFTYDARGNLTYDGVNTYAYDLENRLTAVSGGAALTLAYDPLGRLRRVTTGGVVTDWLWDGDRLVGEYDAWGSLTARYAHGPGPDEPLADWTNRELPTFYLADHQGSIVGLSGTGASLVGTPYTYSPYGEPDATHGYGGPRFRFTGQTSLPGVPPLWHYKARAYAPGIGRFLQTDPIGYEDSLNLYQYVGNDPFNAVDPDGKTARVYVNSEARVVTVVIPVTVRGSTPFRDISRSISSLSQTVTDDAGEDWQVRFVAVEGSLQRGFLGLNRYTNTFRTDNYRDSDTGTASEGFRQGGNQTVRLSPNPSSATIAHEGGGHASGLRDIYDRDHNGYGVPNENYPGNLMNIGPNGGAAGLKLEWDQVKTIMSPESGNDVRISR